MDITAKHTRVGRKKKVPLNRFDNFNFEWNEKLFGEVFIFKITNSFSRELLNYEGGYVKNIHYGDIHTKFKTKFDITLEEVPFVNNEVDTTNIKDENFCKEGDLVIADASEDSNDVGKAIEIVNLDNQKVVAGLHTYIARAKEGFFAPGFVGYLMQTWVVRLQIMMLAQGSKVFGISTRHLNLIFFKIPSIPEQQKIADFLSAVDKKIEQLTRKKELLEQYKKGVMQKIFSQEIRFKQEDGSDYPDWEEKQLSKFLIPTFREIPTPSEPYLAIGIRSHCKGTFQKPNSDPNKIALEKLFVVKENDLVVNITFAWEGAIALIKNEDNGGLVSHRFPTYRFDRKKVLNEFFKYVIIQKKFIHTLGLISPGGAGRNRVLSKKDFLKIKWKIPEIAEQKKNSTFLDTLEQKIETINNQLMQTQQFKKGLLQQMFV